MLISIAVVFVVIFLVSIGHLFPKQRLRLRARLRTGGWITPFNGLPPDFGPWLWTPILLSIIN